MTKFEDNLSPYLTEVEQGSTPATPASGNQKLFIRTSDHLLCYVNSSGTVTPVSAGFANPMTTVNDIIIGGSSGTPTRLATANSKALVTDGSGNISWGTAAGSGALVFLEAHTASSSASLDFTTFISGTYDTYLIEGFGLVPATNTADMNLEIGTGGGPTYDTGSNYEWVGNGYRSDGVGHTNIGSSGVTKLFNSMSNTAAYGFGTFSLTATNLQSTALRKILHGTAQFVDSSPGNCFNVWGMSWNTSGTAVTALRFIMSSGNITSGTIRIYGITKV